MFFVQDLSGCVHVVSPYLFLYPSVSRDLETMPSTQLNSALCGKHLLTILLLFWGAVVGGQFCRSSPSL